MARSPIKSISLAEPGVEVENLAGGGMVLRSPQLLEAYPASQSTWIEQWADRTPDTVFVADRTGKDGTWREITYGDFLNKVRAVGQALLNRGLTTERPVALISDNSVDNALLLFGAMHVGIPAVPISPAYSLMSQDFGKLKFITELVTPGLVFAEDGTKFAAALAAVDFGDAEIVVSRQAPADIEVTEFSSLLSTAVTDAVDDAAKKVTPDTIAKILFTSGSTGLPKGVINTQRMLCSNQVAMSQVWTFLNDHPPVTLDWLPWNHTFGGNHNLNMMLRNGGTMYVDDGKPAPGIIERTIANLKEISPTIYYNVPRGFDMLLPYLEADSDLRDTFFKDLDVLFYAAAALTQSAWERLEAQSEAAIGQRVMMLAGWGATETAPDCTHVHWPIEKAGVIGLPIPGCEIKLISNEEKMEIRVRGANVTPGYWKRDDLTEAAFDADGFYRIGDAARFEDPADAKKGIVFDGRVSENFKLSTGTWVFVGGLRTHVVSAAATIIQDVAIAGHDKNVLGILVFPNVAGCRGLCPGIADDAPLADVLASPEVIKAFKDALETHNLEHPSSSTRIARVLLLTEPPDIDANEITDKGYLNQRAVLSRRAGMVEKLYSDDPEVLVIG